MQSICSWTLHDDVKYELYIDTFINRLQLVIGLFISCLVYIKHFNN